MPAARWAASGAMPEPSRMFEVGQWATPVRALLAAPSLRAACGLRGEPHVGSAPASDSAKRDRTRPVAFETSTFFVERFAQVGVQVHAMARASSAVARIKSGVTENGEHGRADARHP